MQPRTRKILLGILFIINLGFLIPLVAADLAGRTDPARWWPVSIAGLFFPFLLIIAFVSALFWLFVKRKYAFVCIAAILLSIPNILITFPLHFSGFKDAKASGNLRVVTWNVNLMNYSAPDEVAAILGNSKIFTTLHDLDADVICLQEFFTAVIPDRTYNFIDSFHTYMGFPYCYFSRDHPKFDGKFYSGTIIFSKYPIIDSSRIAFPGTIDGSIIKTAILFKNDTINVVSTHLQNINFGRDEDKALQDTDPSTGQVNGFVNKLRYGYLDQETQVNSIRKIIDGSKGAVIFAGDLNDVPTTYTYRNIKKDMKDAWLQKGTGLGSTFNFILHVLRIDYIFFNKYFEAVQTTRIVSDASDHYGVVTDLQLVK